jgi:hypothetical protein
MRRLVSTLLSLSLFAWIAGPGGLTSADAQCSMHGVPSGRASAAMSAREAEPAEPHAAGGMKMPCHEAADPRPAEAPPSRSQGGGCCDGPGGVPCAHACHLVALPMAEASLSRSETAVPFVLEAPASSPDPLPRGVDHIPLA